MTRKYQLKINDVIIPVEVDGPNNGILNVTIGEASFPVSVTDRDRHSGTFKVTVGDVKHTIHLFPKPDASDFALNVKQQQYDAELTPLTRPTTFTPKAATPSPTTTFTPSTVETSLQEPFEPGTVTAPLPGRVLEVQVKEGQKVKIGDVLLVLEAMKMANEIRTTQAGQVKTLHVKAGDTVEKGQPMVTLQ